MPARFVLPLPAQPANPGSTSPTPAHLLLGGNGETTAWVPFSADEGQVISGLWQSEPFHKKKAHPDEMEFCYLIEGRVALTDAEGNRSEFGAGEAFVVQPGFDGTWESLTFVRKYFVIAKCA